MWRVTASVIVNSPPVRTAAAMNPPISKWSESQVHSPPLSFSTPIISILFDHMPVMFAPRALRKWQSSWVCGSQAALYIVVLPGTLEARRMRFSVPVTDGNRCRTSVAFNQPLVVRK